MNQGLIPQRYAKALYKVALERNCSEQLYDYMCTLADSFSKQPALGEVMGNPYIDAARKQQLLLTASGITTAEALPTLTDFIKLLERNKRLPYMRDIALAYVALYRKVKNISTVTVTSAAPLDAEASGRLKGLIESHCPNSTIEYTEHVDPSLIGGFTIAIDNERLDASIKNELKQLRLKLLSH